MRRINNAIVDVPAAVEQPQARRYETGSQAPEHDRRRIKKRKGGSPRQPRKRGGAISMGRYPLQAYINQYLEKRREKWAPETYIERTRKLKYIGRAIVEMHRAGEIRTENPKQFGEPEIRAIESWMKRIGLDPATRSKYRGMVSNFLAYLGNTTYLNEIKYGEIDTRVPPKTIKTLSSHYYGALLA